MSAEYVEAREVINTPPSSPLILLLTLNRIGTNVYYSH